MELRKSSRLLACTGLVALALLSGCGSSSSTTTIPTVASIFYGHNMVFRNNTAMTMGYNGFGQLGLGSLSNLPFAAKVPNTGPVHAGATGGEHTLAFGDGNTVMAWGYNLYGQLGTPLISNGNTATSYSSVPMPVTLPAQVSGVAAGGYHSLAIAGGVVYSWGYNAFGQIGNGNFTNAVTPGTVLNPFDAGSPLGSGGTTGAAIQVAAGSSHSLALMSDGTLMVWGKNNVGQLGVATPNGYSAAPQPLSFAPRVITQIVAEGINSYARASDGTVWAWGYNFDGELGTNPALASSGVPLQVMKNSTTPLYASKIAAGGNHVLVMQSSAATPDVPDNTVWAWGFNGFGQLGNGDLTRANQSTPVQVQGIPTGTVIDIQAFGDYSMVKLAAPDNLGTWYGWGDNEYGQLGNPIATNTVGYLLNPVIVQGYRP